MKYIQSFMGWKLYKLATPHQGLYYTAVKGQKRKYGNTTGALKDAIIR